MRERRQLRVLRRQQMLGQIARREAMRALADAVADETRSANLARRSRDLAAAYRARGSDIDGAALSEITRFSSGLAALARDADQSREVASEKAEQGKHALAAADNRMQRIADKAQQASRDLSARLERREAADGQGLAYKLLSTAKPDQAPEAQEPMRKRKRR